MHRSIIFCLLLFTSGSTFSQPDKFDMGIEGGPGVISLRGNDQLKKHKSRISYSGGIFFQYHFTKLISIRTGMGYERKGSVITQPVTDNFGYPMGDLTTRSNFHYLTLPLLAGQHLAVRSTIL